MRCSALHQVQGLIISQMLRKSVETRDWVNTIEPRNVRAVMKRVVEDTTSIDVQVLAPSLSLMIDMYWLLSFVVDEIHK